MQNLEIVTARVALSDLVTHIRETKDDSNARIITAATLIASAMNAKREVELQYLKHGYVPIAEKRELPVRSSPGFYHVGTVQRTRSTLPIVEAEPALMRQDGVQEFIAALAVNLLLESSARGKLGILDMFQALPKDHRHVEAFGPDYAPLQMAKGETVSNIRLHSWGGLHATRSTKSGSELLFMPPTTDGRTVFDLTRAVVSLVFDRPIVFLNRVDAGKGTIVATDDRGVNHKIDVRMLAGGVPTKMAQIVGSYENGSMYVGSPLGNGIKNLITIGTKGGETSLQVWPKDEKRFAPLVSAAAAA